jgi:hypothetical protein
MQKDLEKKEWQITGYRGKKRRRRRGRMVLLEVYMLYIYIFIGFLPKKEANNNFEKKYVCDTTSNETKEDRNATISSS